MTAPIGITPTIVAVDWSGAKAPSGQRKGICVAIADGGDPTPSADRTRVETIELIERLPGPLVVGFDFSFGFPAWFAAEHGCRDNHAVWAMAEREGEHWLRPTPPFWRDRQDLPPARRYRQCEERLRATGFMAKSIFQIVGVGMVGPGSVRGMPLLARLRERGFAIWPFDPPGDRTVVEIYPTRLRPLAPAHLVARDFKTKDERDAVLSAAVMWEHRAAFSGLEAATDPVTRIEGAAWLPVRD